MCFDFTLNGIQIAYVLQFLKSSVNLKTVKLSSSGQEQQLEEIGIKRGFWLSFNPLGPSF